MTRNSMRCEARPICNVIERLSLFRGTDSGRFGLPESISSSYPPVNFLLSIYANMLSAWKSRDGRMFGTCAPTIDAWVLTAIILSMIHSFRPRSGDLVRIRKLRSHFRTVAYPRGHVRELRDAI